MKSYWDLPQHIELPKDYWPGFKVCKMYRGRFISAIVPVGGYSYDHRSTVLMKREEPEALDYRFYKWTEPIDLGWPLCCFHFIWEALEFVNNDNFRLDQMIYIIPCVFVKSEIRSYDFFCGTLEMRRYPKGTALAEKIMLCGDLIIP